MWLCLPALPDSCEFGIIHVHRLLVVWAGFGCVCWGWFGFWDLLRGVVWVYVVCGCALGCAAEWL